MLCIPRQKRNARRIANRLRKHCLLLPFRKLIAVTNERVSDDIRERVVNHLYTICRTRFFEVSIFQYDNNAEHFGISIKATGSRFRT